MHSGPRSLRGSLRRLGDRREELDRSAGVTVRTLHHYDEICLLVPTARTPAGYRQYTLTDLERLQRILCYRELGFELDKIAAILDDPDIDPVDHLRRQHVLLTDRMERLQAMIRAVEKTMEAHTVGINLTPDELFEVFGDEDPSRHADEAQQRWGDTDAWSQSQRRTSRYGKTEWLALTQQAHEIDALFVAALQAGHPPARQRCTATSASSTSATRASPPTTTSRPLGSPSTSVTRSRQTPTAPRTSDDHARACQALRRKTRVR